MTVSFSSQLWTARHISTRAAFHQTTTLTCFLCSLTLSSSFQKQKTIVQNKWNGCGTALSSRKRRQEQNASCTYNIVSASVEATCLFSAYYWTWNLSWSGLSTHRPIASQSRWDALGLQAVYKEEISGILWQSPAQKLCYSHLSLPRNLLDRSCIQVWTLSQITTQEMQACVEFHAIK